jgi:hypothetical protein
MHERWILQLHTQKRAESRLGQRVGIVDEEVVKDKRKRSEEHEQKPNSRAHPEEVLRVKRQRLPRYGLFMVKSCSSRGVGRH